MFEAAYESAFTLWATPVSRVELVAFVLAIAMVVLNMRVDARAWPLAIVSSLLYFALFWHSRLYGDAGLQLFFALIAGWGWWRWTHDRSPTSEAPRVQALPGGQRAGLIVALALGWPVMGWFLKRWTDTDVPWWDAFPTTLSVIGQWLLGRKYVENWPVWIVVNIASIGLYAYKGLWLTVLLYAIFIAMSVAGWRTWQRLAAGTPIAPA